MTEEIHPAENLPEQIISVLKRLDEAQKLARMGDFTWNLDTGKVEWSAAMYELLEYNTTEKINLEKVNADIHHPDDLELVMSWLNNCIASGKQDHGPKEYRLITKTGRELHVQTIISVRFENGKAKEVFGTVQDITKRKQAELKLKKSNENLRVTLQSIGDGVITTDSGGLVTALNPVAEKLTGFKTAEAAGKPIESIFNIVNALTGKKVENPAKKVFETGHTIGLANHTKLISRDGKEYHIADSAAPIKNKNGKIMGVVLVFRDVSEQYRMTEALKASEERYRTVFENTGTATCIIEKDGTISLANSRFTQLAGYPAGEIENRKTWMEFVVPEDLLRMQHQHELRRKSREEALKEYEFGFVNKQQSIRYIHLFIDVIPGTDKSVASLLDITERKKMEIALRENEARFKSVFESANVGKSITKPTGEINVNKAFCDMLGYSRAEMENKKWQDITPPDEIEPIEKIIEPLLEGTRDSTRFEKRYIHKNGSYIWTDVSVAIYRDADRKPLYFLTTVVDITERRKTEEALQEQQVLLTAIYRNAPLVLMLVDAERRIQQVNGFAAQFAGRDVEDMIGLRGGEALRCLHALDDPKGCGFGTFCKQCMIRNTVLDTLETKKTHLQIEAPYYFQKNENVVQEMTFMVSTTPITVKDKDLVLVTLQDITERKNAEEQLKEYNKKLEQAEKNAHLGSWEVDLKTGKTWWSKQMFKLLGFEQSDSAPGFEEYLEHIHPDDQEKLRVVLDKLKKGVVTSSMEYRGNPDFTGQRYLLSRAEGVKDQTGKLIKITGTVLDITAQKLIENEINKLKENLEEQVKEKTIELQERIDELERYRDATIEREFRMKELREEIERLKREKND